MSLKDFEIGKELGKGAFGSVCIVKRKIDKKTYAMKRVKISQLSEKEKENALNEIRILASLSHVNIIGYKEAFFDEPSKTLNIVMEYADDGDIASKIKYNLKHGLLFKESIIWDYFIQILKGLQYLHENKVIHRDLKSANLFLMKDGTLKIGDLNVSKIIKMGLAYTQTGTPYYASPEIWKDKPYNYKCDIWSVGCIIYELCTLKPPFKGTSLKELCMNIQRGTYNPIPGFYSSELRQIIDMILKVDPKARPDTETLLRCDIITRKMRERHEDIDGVHKANFIGTIKMPRNLKEINKKLPMKRYNNRQKQEMFLHDQYETSKQGFFKDNQVLEGIKEVQDSQKPQKNNRGLDEVLDFFNVDVDKKPNPPINYNNLNNNYLNNRQNHNNNYNEPHYYAKPREKNTDQKNNNRNIIRGYDGVHNGLHNNEIGKKPLKIVSTPVYNPGKYQRQPVVHNGQKNVRNIKPGMINNIRSPTNQRPPSQNPNPYANNKLRIQRVQNKRPVSSINRRPGIENKIENQGINRVPKPIKHLNPKSRPYSGNYNIKYNNDFKLRNGVNVINNNNNVKKKKVIIEKINYKKGQCKLDKMKEYEKQRVKNLNQNINHYQNLYRKNLNKKV